MRLYFAAAYNSHFGYHGPGYEILNDWEKQVRRNTPDQLESYHYIHNPKFVEMIRRDGIQVFLDSGAFSSFTRGVEVDIEAYCRYIHEYGDIIRVASVLDGIGDPQKTYDNQNIMEANGTAPLPCFHYGEDERWLSYYIDRYEYITLGGMVPISTPQLILWLDRIWEHYLTDDSGSPRIAVHGFGLTSAELMRRYPWYSVDSSSWLQISSFGNVFIPEYGIVAFSSTSPKTHDAKAHFDTMPHNWRIYIEDAVRRRGFLVDNLRAKYHSRRVFNIATYNELRDECAKQTTFKASQPLWFA